MRVSGAARRREFRAWLLDNLHRAQDGLCVICSEPLERFQRYHCRRGWTVEHIWPRRYRFELLGCAGLSHAECNNQKRDLDPTGCERIMLEAINARLGFTLKVRPPCERQPEPTSYADPMIAPSALALQLGSLRESAVGQ